MNNTELANIRQTKWNKLSKANKPLRILMEIQEIKHDADNIKQWLWHGLPTLKAQALDKRIQRLLSHCKNDYTQHITKLIKDT